MADKPAGLNSSVVTKQRIFKIFAIAGALLLLVFSEIILTAADYGGNPDLFVKYDDALKPYYTINRNIGRLYFSGSAFLLETSHDLFLVDKPAGSYRIFVLGGSTAAAGKA